MGVLGGVFVLKSGLRIFIRAPEVPFLVSPKTPKMTHFGRFGTAAIGLKSYISTDTSWCCAMSMSPSLPSTTIPARGQRAPCSSTCIGSPVSSQTLVSLELRWIREYSWQAGYSWMAAPSFCISRSHWPTTLLSSIVVLYSNLTPADLPCTPSRVPGPRVTDFGW